MDRIVAAIAAALLMSVLAGCSAFEPADCRKADLATYADSMETQIRAFRQQSELVGASPRISMGAPLQRLLDIQTETRAIQAPGCVAGYHERVVGVMQVYQQQYQDFAAQRGDATVIAMVLGQLGPALDQLEQQLDTIRAGSPPPTLTPLPPTPSPEVLAEPEPGVVGTIAFISPVAGGGAGNVGALCDADTFEITARQELPDETWVKVRVLTVDKGSTTCEAAASAIGRVTVGTEGWLRDSEVLAP